MTKRAEGAKQQSGGMTKRKTMKRIVLLAVTLIAVACGEKVGDGGTYDLCVYGGTASGVMAGYAAAQEGLRVVIVEPTERFGGMTTGGLGQTDIGNKQVVKGLALQFYRRLGSHYGNLENWIFEPSAAEEVLNEYINHPLITAIKGYHLTDVRKKGTDIVSIKVASGVTGFAANETNSSSMKKAATLRLNARWFIDCSYEGDLMAKAGVSYRVGREGNIEYNETWDGVQLLQGHQFPDGVDPYIIKGDPSSGLLWGVSPRKLMPKGVADSLVQAYNYRICLTDSLENSIPIEKPENYDPAKYELLLRLLEAQPDKRDKNDYFIWSPMPGRKTDINNRGGFSTDMIGMNWDYPEASWGRRQEIIKEHKDYTLGLLYFMGNDPRVPAELRDDIARWGLPKDEYMETGHWTPQLYVRECRRMEGEYVATQADCENRHMAREGIAMAAYTMDSHNCQRIVVDGMVKNEGNVEIYGGLPYPISYRSITPKRAECTNLLVPVCCSATHIAYGSIRMEPVFMCLGQAAGLAVAIASKKHKSSIQSVDYKDILKILDTDPFQDGTPPDIIIDDTKAAVPEGWRQADMGGCYGRSSLISFSAGVPAVFSTTIPRSGNYTLYSYQHRQEPGINPVTIITLANGRTYRINASQVKIAGQTSGAWHPLGTIDLKAGEQFSASITSDGNKGIVFADAIMLVQNRQAK